MLSPLAYCLLRCAARQQERNTSWNSNWDNTPAFWFLSSRYHPKWSVVWIQNQKFSLTRFKTATQKGALSHTHFPRIVQIFCKGWISLPEAHNINPSFAFWNTVVSYLAYSLFSLRVMESSCYHPNLESNWPFSAYCFLLNKYGCILFFEAKKYPLISQQILLSHKWDFLQNRLFFQFEILLYFLLALLFETLPCP